MYEAAELIELMAAIAATAVAITEVCFILILPDSN
jgi:hypothetical protein